MEVDSDIYDNIPITDSNELYEEIDKLRQQNNLLQELINSLEGDVEKLCAKITEMKKIQDNLTKNISELFKTAKAELERKDRTITELRSQLESFQRNKSNYSMKREREKSPSVGRLPPEHVAKRMRQDDESRTKRDYFRRSRSRSRSTEESRRYYRDRRGRFGRPKYDHDSRRVRDDKYVDRGHRSKYDSRDYDRREITKKEATEVKNGAEMDRRNALEKKNAEITTDPEKKKELDKRQVVVILTEMEETAKPNNNFENGSKIEKDSVAKRNVDTETGKDTLVSYVKETAKVKSNVDSVDKVEEEKEKKEVTNSNLEETGISSVEREKAVKEVEQNETAIQRNLNEVANITSHDQTEEKVIKENSLPGDQKEVTNEKNEATKRGPDQKKIVVRKNIKGLIVKNKAGVKTQNKKCSNNEECISPTGLPSNADEEKEKSNTNEKKNQTPPNKQSEENLTTKKDSSTKVNKTKIEEITQKLFERLEEEAKQEPQKSTVQVVDSAVAVVDKAEMKKAKIEEVTRRLFGNFEDEEEELPETASSKMVDVAEHCNKSEAKTVGGVKIEALSKKLRKKLKEEHDVKKSAESVNFEAVDDKNEEISKTKTEDAPENLFRGVEEDTDDNEQKATSTSSAVTDTEEIGLKNGKKVEEVAQEVIPSLDGETKPLLQKPTRSDDVKEVNNKSRDEISKMRNEEVSKKLFEEAVEEDNQKPASVSSTVTGSEEITDDSRKLEETKQVTEKSTPKCLKLDNFSEADDNSEDEDEMKIAEMSKKLFQAIIEEEKEDDAKRKLTSVESTETCANKVEEKGVNANKSEEMSKKSKTEAMDVNLTESIKNSVDFTKKRHDMMYGEVAKEISIFIPEHGATKVSSKHKETNQNNNEPPSKKEKKEDAKAKVNDKHKDKKKTNAGKDESNKKSNKQKSQRADKEKKKSDTTQKNESSKLNKHDEKKKEMPSEVSDAQKADQEKKNVSSKPNKHDEKKKEMPSAVLDDHKAEQEKKNVSSIQNEDTRDSGKRRYSKDHKEDQAENEGDVLMKDESSKHDREKNSEVPSKIQEVEAEKSESPTKSSSKESKPTSDTKSKKTKENARKDTKNKDDDSSGSIVKESDRVLRSATRRSSRLQEETQKKNPHDTTNQKNKESDTKLDLNPAVELKDVISVNLSHDGEIPVLHISEDSHLLKNSTLFSLDDCPSVVTSSPIKSDLNNSFNSSGLNGSNSFSEPRIFNTSSGKKRRRVVLTMVD